METIKVLRGNVKNDHYKGAPCLIWCFDDRFTKLLNDFIVLLKEKEGLDYVDVIKIAGGAKTLASLDSQQDKEFLIKNIEASFLLHECPWIGLMCHSDCGAYGKKFKDESEEKNFYISELVNAKNNLMSIFLEKNSDLKNLPVRLYYVDFTGIHEIV
jgi:hypothetical protein